MKPFLCHVINDCLAYQHRHIKGDPMIIETNLKLKDNFYYMKNNKIEKGQVKTVHASVSEYKISIFYEYSRGKIEDKYCFKTIQGLTDELEKGIERKTQKTKALK